MHYQTRVPYELLGGIGTEAALPATLTASNAILCRMMKRLHVGGSYTPGSANSIIVLLIEISHDSQNELPTNWEQWTTASAGTTEIDVFDDGGFTLGATPGIPLILPGDKTSSAGVQVPINWDFDDLVANWVRIRYKEVPTGAAGTAHISLALRT